MKRFLFIVCLFLTINLFSQKAAPVIIKQDPYALLAKVINYSGLVQFNGSCQVGQVSGESFFDFSQLSRRTPTLFVTYSVLGKVAREAGVLNNIRYVNEGNFNTKVIRAEWKNLEGYGSGTFIMSALDEKNPNKFYVGIEGSSWKYYINIKLNPLQFQDIINQLTYKRDIVTQSSYNSQPSKYANSATQNKAFDETELQKNRQKEMKEMGSILRVLPDETSEAIYWIPKNSQVTLIEKDSYYAKVKINDKTGYITLSDFKNYFTTVKSSNNHTLLPAIKEVKIGNQIWMLNNLNVDTFSNGDLIEEAKTIEEWRAAFEAGKPAWCYYKNDPANGLKYGKMYNWFAATDPRGIAPKGWRVPRSIDYNDLVWFIHNKYDMMVSKHLKSNTGWKNNFYNGSSGNGDNACGFTGKPGGLRITYGNQKEEGINGGFIQMGFSCYWWACGTIGDKSNDEFYLAFNDNDHPSNPTNSDGLGMYIRCIKN